MQNKSLLVPPISVSPGFPKYFFIIARLVPLGKDSFFFFLRPYPQLSFLYRCWPVHHKTVNSEMLS